MKCKRPSEVKPESDKILELAKEIGEPVVLQRDVRILRECVAWSMKYLPRNCHAHADGVLKRFSEAVKDYCQCAERSLVAKTGKYTCLDCGQKYKTARGE